MQDNTVISACTESVIDRGLSAAAGALSTMVGRKVTMTSPLVKLVPLGEVPGLAGGAGQMLVAIYLGLGGDLGGHLVFLLTESSAVNLMAALLDEPGASTLSLTELQRSALAEVGNVSGCAFLNSLADAINMRITPTTPIIVCDMAGAILDAMLADIGQTSDQALVIQTQFRTSNKSGITGYFLLLPDADGLRRVFSALEAACG